jgi:two-component system, chemotaxis family, CheB/CheR fusion protein
MPGRAAFTTKTGLVASQMDNTNAEFRRHSRRLFSVLRAIVRRSSDSASNKRDLAARIESRIGALARVHEMIMRSPREGIDFEELVHEELLAQAVSASQYRAAGPDTRIGSEAAFSLALALHELAVNSVIHGAFTTSQGLLEVSWDHVTRDAREWLQVIWQESGSQASGDQPTLKGFGLELLERSLPYELDACTRVEWQPGGARVELQIPAGAASSSWARGERSSSP